ncbi:MAG: sulfite exporter TauE/SafE family protein, partial [Limisphaerales bacterium]
LFPGQVTTGWAGHKSATGTARLSFKAFFIISLIGGAFGAFLLLLTPPSFFAKLVPWLVLFATSIFGWGSFFRKPTPDHEPLSPWLAGGAQFLIAIYGGYFGGGIGFLMLAALTIAGLKVRPAAASKNVLAAVMNASAVVIFLFSKEIAWLNAIILGGGAVIGGLIGAHLLQRVNERVLRIGIVVLGLALTVGLFLRQ